MTAPWAVLLVSPRREDRPWQNNVLANDSVCSAAMAALSAKEVAANRCVLANSLCGGTCRGGAADKKREWKKAAFKFAYVFPFGNRLRWRVLSKLVGKKNSVVGPQASICAARWIPRGAGRSQQGCRVRSPMPPRQRRRFRVFTH